MSLRAFGRIINSTLESRSMKTFYSVTTQHRLSHHVAISPPLPSSSCRLAWTRWACSYTATVTATVSATVTATVSATVTATVSATVTTTVSATVTATVSATVTTTVSATVTATVSSRLLMLLYPLKYEDIPQNNNVLSFGKPTASLAWWHGVHVRSGRPRFESGFLKTAFFPGQVIPVT